MLELSSSKETLHNCIRAGYKKSLDAVKAGFMNGIITKDEYANILRAYQQRHDEMKSDTRDKAEELGSSFGPM